MSGIVQRWILSTTVNNQFKRM